MDAIGPFIYLQEQTEAKTQVEGDYETSEKKTLKTLAEDSR